MSYRYNISSSLEKRFSISYNLFIAVSVIYFFRYFMKTHRAGFVRKEQKVHLMIMAVLVTLVFFANFCISAFSEVFYECRMFTESLLAEVVEVVVSFNPHVYVSHITCRNNLCR